MTTKATYARRREAFLVALETGVTPKGLRVKQTNGCLHVPAEKPRKTDCACCLGVAQIVQNEIAQKRDRIKTTLRPPIGDEKNALMLYGPCSSDDLSDGNAWNLTPEAVEYYGFHGIAGNLHARHYCKGKDGEAFFATSLMQMNDNGVSFKKIAAFIRANPQSVWKEGTY